MYADDTTLIIKGDTSDDIKLNCQEVLNRVNNYLVKNCLFLNVEKTAIMSFNNTEIDVKYENKLIKNVSSFKILGIILDNKFKFSEQTYQNFEQIDLLEQSIT